MYYKTNAKHGITISVLVVRIIHKTCSEASEQDQWAGRDPSIIDQASQSDYLMRVLNNDRPVVSNISQS